MSEVIDPIRTSEAAVVSNESEVVLVFHKAVLKKTRAKGEHKFEADLSTIGAFAMPWGCAEGLHAVLGEMLQRRRVAKAVMPGPEVAAPH